MIVLKVKDYYEEKEDSGFTIDPSTGKIVFTAIMKRLSKP